MQINRRKRMSICSQLHKKRKDGVLINHHMHQLGVPER